MGRSAGGRSRIQSLPFPSPDHHLTQSHTFATETRLLTPTPHLSLSDPPNALHNPDIIRITHPASHPSCPLAQRPFPSDSAASPPFSPFSTLLLLYDCPPMGHKRRQQLTGARIFGCRQCSTHLTTIEQLISKVCFPFVSPTPFLPSARSVSVSLKLR